MSLMQDVAHDLRDELNVIAVNVELLARATETNTRTVGDGLSPPPSLEVVRRALSRLDHQIDVFLGGRPIEQHTAKLVDVAEIGKALVELVGPRAARQHVAISLTTPGVLRTKGFADRLHGAVLTLLVNALDAMPTGGKLDIVLTGRHGVQVEVRDTGPGIPADVQRAMWAPGFTTKMHNDGLGLAVARSVVEAHGGTIGYEPNPQGGSRFVVLLPSLSHQ